MNDNLQEVNLIESLSYESILNVFIQKWKYILCATLFGAIAAAFVGLILIQPKYTSNVTLYVSNGYQSVDNVAINMADINASQSLVRTCLVLIKGRSVLEQVEASLNRPDYGIEQLERVVSCKSVEGTEILEVAVETPEPELSMEIAKKIGEIVPIEMQRVFKAGSAIVVDSARLPKKKSSPNVVLLTLSCSASAMLASSLWEIAVSVLDQSVKGQSDFEKQHGVPVLGVLHSTIHEPLRNLGIAGPWDIANESELVAYKLLRTNVMFCLSQKPRRRVVFSSVSLPENKPIIKKHKSDSANRKAATAVNFAIVLAQTGAKVVLLDADLRDPTVHKILEIIRREQGMSTILSSESLPESLRYSLEETVYPNLSVICSGFTPPNPTELFEGKKTSRMLDLLEREFDYIIIDAPDINSYTDALALSNNQCNIILTVQERQSDHRQIKKAIKSIELVDGIMLGAVITNSK